MVFDILPTIPALLMAAKRFINNRQIRHCGLCLISFLFGIFLHSWFIRNEQKELLCDHDVSDIRLRNQVDLNNRTIPKTNSNTTATTMPATTIEPYPPLLNSKDLMITPKSCPNNVFLLVLVITSSRNFEARKAIRRSWGLDSSQSNQTNSLRVVFVLGSDGENDRLIAREAKRYKDVLRGSFEDVYRQNSEHSVKVLLGFKWASQSCKAKFILRVSSESFVNVPGMMKYFQEKRTAGLTVSGVYMGFCHGLTSGGANIVRNPLSPWYISQQEWPDQYLPPYASSIGIGFSFDVIQLMVKLSIKEKLIHIDDVYLGILATNLSIKCQDEASRFDTSYTTMFTECEDLSFHIVGGVPSKDMFYLNQNVKNLREICTR